MQVQKDEVKNRILEAAKEEFLLSGYQNSSMRRIADSAGITPGNIYAYFSGKDDLFDNVIMPVLEQINELFDMQVGIPSEMNIQQITQTITNMFLEYKHEFIILMNGSTGSQYENIKKEIVSLAHRRIQVELLPNLSPINKDPLLADTLAVALIEGVLNIFNKYGGDRERLSMLLHHFMLIIFHDVIS